MLLNLYKRIQLWFLYRQIIRRFNKLNSMHKAYTISHNRYIKKYMKIYLPAMLKWLVAINKFISLANMREFNLDDEINCIVHLQERYNGNV